LGTGTGITGSERGAWYPRGWHGDEHLLVHVMCYGVLSACRRRCPPAAFLVLQLQRQHRNIATSQQHGQVYIIRKLAHMLPPPHHFLSLSSSQPLNRFHIQFSVVQTSSSLPALNPFTNFAHSAISTLPWPQLLQLMLHVG